jgi:hypothetical protein
MKRRKGMVKKDGTFGYKLQTGRIRQGAKLFWRHPEIYTARRRLSIRLWAIWDGPKYFWQINVPPYNKAVGGMTNTICLKRPFFELLETGTLLTLSVATIAIVCG